MANTFALHDSFAAQAEYSRGSTGVGDGLSCRNRFFTRAHRCAAGR